MSNQFSYELDERQIRILMLNSEADYNENAWQRFEGTISNSSSVKVLSKTALPKINISISRSFIIPVLFIGLIGGLSLLLFSFVDFKKKDEVMNEKPLEITKPTVKAKPSITKNNIKPKPNLTLAPKESPVLITTNSTKSNSLSIQPEKKEAIPVTQSPKAEALVTVNTATNTTAPNNKPITTKTKKRKKIVVEELPTITTPAVLNSSSEEPELDLK